MNTPDTRENQGVLDRLDRSTDRRSFLRWSGVASAAVIAAACMDDGPTAASTDAQSFGNAKGNKGKGKDNNGKGPITEGAESVTIDFSSDIGVLNYAYALEQLEAAFYIMVIENFYNGGSSEEREVMEDLRAHEIVHREFFATALGSAAIPTLSFDFTKIQFKSRGKVLQTAEDFEFLGVSAYNGAAALLDSTDLLILAGKIVSVEARHASAIADLRRPNGKSFAPRPFSLARSPAEVLAIASAFIQTDVTVVGL